MAVVVAAENLLVELGPLGEAGRGFVPLVKAVAGGADGDEGFAGSEEVLYMLELFRRQGSAVDSFASISPMRPSMKPCCSRAA